VTGNKHAKHTEAAFHRQSNREKTEKKVWTPKDGCDKIRLTEYGIHVCEERKLTVFYRQFAFFYFSRLIIKEERG
jgi:hypothetical protein